MPLKTEPIDEPNLNLTPMIDVVFLLIIFFMVGTRFTQLERQYDINLPTVSDAQPLTEKPDDIVVNVSREGGIVVRGEAKTPEQLEAELATARENYPGQGVVIRGDAQGAYQNVMDVLVLCRRAGIAAVSLSGQPVTGEGTQ